MERLIVHPDARLTARAAGLRLLLTLIEAQGLRAPLHVALTGGGMGIRMLAEIAGETLADAVDWDNVHLWWGDERFAEDELRNASQARAAWIDGLPIPPGNVHEVARPSEVATVEEAAAAYGREVAGVRFTVVILGLGPDGHVASLFPGRPEVDAEGLGALPVRNSPKPPPERVTLTRELLCNTEQLWFVVAGADRGPTVAAAMHPQGAPLPSARVRGRNTLWLVDAALAARLPVAPPQRGGAPAG